MIDLQHLANSFEAFQHQTRAQFQRVEHDFHVVHGERAAMDLWLHAVISSHPDPAALKAEVQRLVGQVEKQGVPSWAGVRRDAFRRMLQNYGNYFDQVYPPKN